MIVIKLGGSLAHADTLTDCLDTVEQYYQDRTVVIVPGGGAFADQVRLAQQHWRFDDRTAHQMAILAMQQMALLCNGLKTDFAVVHSVAAIKAQSLQNKILIWSPACAELDLAGIPSSWDITSDSLAAWLAGALPASELILVKSAVVDAEHTLPQLAAQGIVDQAFCGFVARAAFKIRVVNQHNFREMSKSLTLISLTSTPDLRQK